MRGMRFPLRALLVLPFGCNKTEEMRVCGVQLVSGEAMPCSLEVINNANILPAHYKDEILEENADKKTCNNADNKTRNNVNKSICSTCNTTVDIMMRRVNVLSAYTRKSALYGC